MRFLLVIVSVFMIMARVSSQPVISPSTQTDEIIIDAGTPGSADPNDRIRYKVTIQNTGSTSATLVQLNAALDGRTSLVAGSFKTSPLAINDTYTATGNVGITVAAANGLAANDFDDNIPGLTITAGTFVTTGGGSITIAANGSFSYNPAAGFTGADTYTYTLNDSNGVGGGVPATDNAVITITVTNMIWFIDNTGGGTGGTGTLTDPFKRLADFNGSSGPSTGHLIFIKYSGGLPSNYYTGGIILKNDQILYATGHTGGTTLADVLPFSLAPNSPPLPTINGSRPNITNTAAGGDGVTLAQNNNLRGFNIGDCGDFGIDNAGTNSVGNLIINEVGIVNSTGGGFDASNGSGTGMNVLFSSLITQTGVNGVDLTNCDGIFAASSGLMSNSSGPTVLISGGSVTVSMVVDLSENSGFIVDIDNHDNNNITFSKTLIATSAKVRIQNCNGGTIAFTGNSKLIAALTNNTAIQLINNTGATINFTGGGLDLSNSGVVCFDVTGGGTINVTGAGNKINSSTGTALSVNATTIGSSNLNFQSITSTSPGPSAIILNNTGSSGGLIVTGTGSAGTGGTISNKTADGISLINTMNTSISWMIINLNNGNGIYGDNLTNFSLISSSVTNNDADNVGTNEAGLRFDDLWGTCFLTSSAVSGTKGDNIRMTPTSGTLTNFTISGSTIGPNPVGTGGNGLALVSIGSGSTTITVTGSSVFTGNQASGFLTTITTGTTSTININNSTFQDNNINVDLGSGSTGVQTINVSNNTLLRAATNSMNIVGDGQINGIINNNNIGNGTPDSGSRDAYDIAVSHRSDTHWNLKITNNTCKNSDFEGIFVRTGDVAGNAGSMDLTLTGNTVFPPDDNSGFPAIPRGIYVRSRQNTALCLNIANNESQGKNGGVGYHLHRSDASSFKMQGFTTDGATTVTANGNKTNALAPTTDTIGEPFQGSCTAP